MTYNIKQQYDAENTIKRINLKNIENVIKRINLKNIENIVLFLILISIYVEPVSANGEFRFDFASQIAGAENYTKHWSNIYPPDPNVNIIIYSYAGNISFKRMSAISYVYVTYDPLGNVVAVDRKDTFQRNYEPVVYYHAFHPKSDWIEGNYKTRIIIYSRIDMDEDVWDEITDDPYGIGNNIGKYKEFYETGGNAEAIGILKTIGYPIAQAVLYFKIDKKVTIYPPDRFLLHDVRFTDDNTERILGEKLQIEVKADNNYANDGTFKLALLVDNTVTSTQDVTIKGFSTSTVTFEAKAGKVGTFRLSFGSDTPDVKFRNAELMFTIKNYTETARLDVPKIEITAMNVDKEFASVNSNITVSISVVNNGKAGNKIITVYSNKMPVGSVDIYLAFLEEKTVEVPITLKNEGINKITLSGAPQLYRNVFVQEEEVQKSVVRKRIEENPLKVSAVAIFIIFAIVLYYLRKRLK